MTTLETFLKARSIGAPIIVYKTPDQSATINALTVALAKQAKEEDRVMPPIVAWDMVRGFFGCNPAGEELAKKHDGMINLIEALQTALTFPERSETQRGTVCYVLNAHRLINEAPIMQAVANVRDKYKGDGRTLVLLCPSIVTPQELVNDVITIDEPLPTEEAIKEIVRNEANNAGAKVTLEEIDKAAEALTGLSSFAAEQSLAMAMAKVEGKWRLNLGDVWERKRTAIEETRGLRVWRGGERFGDIGGCGNVKGFLGRFLRGKQPPHAVVFIDEIEKSLAGSNSEHGDNSGTSQDQLAVLLTEMQDNNVQGVLFIGCPGSAKSMIAKATGNEANIPTIALDLGAMKGGIVGESQANIRAAVKVIQAMSQGNALYIATCNRIGAIPPELQRRFTLGTFFFDLPNEDERKTIWKLYADKYSVEPTKNDLRSSEGWTGADIAACCHRAYMFDASVAEAAKDASPLIQTRPKIIEELRRMADGAFISASEPGIYTMKKTETKTNGTRYN